LLKVWESWSNPNRHFAKTGGAGREASVNNREAPTKSKRSPHGAQPPGASPDEAESAQEWEAETPEEPAALECESEELPDIDEETKVVLLPVNPYLVHVYWGIAANDLEEIERVFRRPGGRAQPVLRFYDITHVNSDGTSAPSWFEVEIDLRAGKWYAHLQSPAKSYCIDLGLRTEGGGFHRLARSNVAETPRAWPSDKVEESYLLVEEDYHRVETVVPPVKPTEVAETLPEPAWGGELYRAEEIRSQPQKPSVFPRFETVAPAAEPAEVAETPPEPLWVGELYRAEEIRPQPRKPRIFPRFEAVVPPVEPAEVVETPPEPPSAGEQHHGEEKGQEPKEFRIFRTAVPGEIERKLAALYRRRMWEWSGFAPKAGGAGGPQPSGKERVDLTELSERNFRAGLWSGRKSS
jgi:hypothetical protein